MTAFTAHAPATLSNLGPGFDVLGLALDGPLDWVRAARRDELGISLRCEGPFGASVPADPEKNVAAFAAARVVEAVGYRGGLELTVHKSIPPGSGLGSSAASSAAGAVAAMGAVGADLEPEALLDILGDAEGLAAGARHLDNVAPALLGGFVAVLSTEPPGVLPLCLSGDWPFAVILPKVQVRTEEARAVLPEKVPMESAVFNLRHMAGLLEAASSGDVWAFAAHLQDRLALPYRAPLLPFADDARAAAEAAGAPALQISGSGPALFCPCPDEEIALAACAAVKKSLEGWQIGARAWVCHPSAKGALARAERSA